LDYLQFTNGNTWLCQRDEDRLGITGFFWHGMKYAFFPPLTQENKGVLNIPHQRSKEIAFYAGCVITWALYCGIGYKLLKSANIHAPTVL
jgi:hypothetical protein